MNYAIRTKDVFVANKPIKTKRKMTAEQKAAREFMEGHTFSVHFNKKTGEAKIDVAAWKS